MAYAWDTFYYFQSHRGTSNLYLNREGSGAVAPNQNISIYKKVGTGANPDHQFKLVRAYDSNGGVAGCTIRSALGSNYALNIYGYGTDMSAEGNCDLYPVGGQYPGSSNYDDSLIDLLTVNADENLYKITLINHQGLYLTPESKSNNANVKWAKSSREDAHVWKLCTSETSGGGGTSGGIEISTYLCQKNHSETWFINNGCAVTAGIMAAAYRDNTTYGIHSFDMSIKVDDEWKPLWTEANGYSWYTPRGWQFVEDDKVYTYPGDAETVAYIKSIIDQGIPPICYCPSGDGHWMLAYSYTSGSTFDAIRIIDPADGTEKSLAEGIRFSCGSAGLSAGITRIRKAPSAH